MIMATGVSCKATPLQAKEWFIVYIAPWLQH